MSTITPQRPPEHNVGLVGCDTLASPRTVETCNRFLFRGSVVFYLISAPPSYTLKSM